MKQLTGEQARVRRRWMTALFVLAIVLTILAPFYVVMTLGGGWREMVLYPNLAVLTAVVLVFLWPVALAVRPVCLAAAGALVACGVVIAVELWRRKRYLEETYGLEKTE